MKWHETIRWSSDSLRVMLSWRIIIYEFLTWKSWMVGVMEVILSAWCLLRLRINRLWCQASGELVNVVLDNVAFS